MATAKKEEKKDEALQSQGSQALARPDFIEQGTKGMEHVDVSDLRLPRLCIAQKSSAQIDDAEPSYIDGLKFLDLFNDVTERIYKPLPLRFAVICAYRTRWIEFKPRSEGGGVVDMNVPPNDPRTQFQGSNKPKATQFYDYIVMLLDHGEIIALSMKGTAIKVARNFNTLIKLRDAPVYAGVYEIGVERATKDNQPYGVYVVRNAPEPDNWIRNEDLYNTLKKAHEEYRDKAHEEYRDKTLDVHEEKIVEEEGRQAATGDSDIPF